MRLTPQEFYEQFATQVHIQDNFETTRLYKVMLEAKQRNQCFVWFRPEAPEYFDACSWGEWLRQAGFEVKSHSDLFVVSWVMKGYIE